MYVIPLLSAATTLGRHGCGSKAYELSRLMEKGYPVPDGIVLPYVAYQRVLENSPVDIGNLQQRLYAAKLPFDLLQVLQPAFTTLVHTYGSVSVRSSATAEDLEDASFAGQYETVLNVKTMDELINALKRCWTSLVDARVVSYARKKNVWIEDCQMAVLVQGMVNAEQSGVGFSIHPVKLDDTIVINASYGLGEAIVSGVVTPDTFEYNKLTGELQKELGLKEVKIVFADSGVQELETSFVEQTRFCLSDHDIYTLVQTIQKLEQNYQSAVDVEFAYQNGQLFLLQVRPITTQKGLIQDELSL